jgi:hypothetical protein
MRSFKNSFLLAILGLLVISAAVDLPLVDKMGFSKDDWYLMYDGHVAGPQFFHEVFSIDRPARAYLQIPLYTFFGENVLLYHLSLFLFDFLSAAALFWLLDMLWPRRRIATFSMALLFLIYPGFLSQVTPIDFQAHILSLCLAMISIALTVKAILADRLSTKIILTIGSILSGLAYPLLMEHFIGLEVFRLMCIVLLLSREKGITLQNRLTSIARTWIPFLVAPFGFLFWHTFIFQNQRKATDVAAQVGQLFTSPIYKGLWWLVTLFQSTFDVIFLAWGVPLYDMAFQLRLRDILIGLAIAISAALIAILIVKGLVQTDNDKNNLEPDWRIEALWVGIISTVGGLLPIVVANRYTDFGDYSRYTLDGMVGGVMIVVALIGFLSSRKIRIALLAILTGIAALKAYANSSNAAFDTEIIHNFWWQISWRVPQLKDGTTLVASYPGSAIEEDYFIWGPANLIYTPEKQTTDPINIRVSAAILTPDIVLQIMTGHGEFISLRRGNSSVQDYSNVLVLTQATSDGCVRVMDGSQPELSNADAQNIMLIAAKSKISNVVLNTNFQSPPPVIFGNEPPHTWCYYYEKADLAAQQGDWKTVASLGEKALSLGFYPSDSVEWMPFLQAYVKLGEIDKLHPLISIINANSFLKMEACQILTHTAQTASADMQTIVQESFCK